jgi:hypothetical protein
MRKSLVLFHELARKGCLGRRFGNRALDGLRKIGFEERLCSRAVQSRIKYWGFGPGGK